MTVPRVGIRALSAGLSCGVLAACLWGCRSAPPPAASTATTPPPDLAPTPRHLVIPILLTSDEHGWLEPHMLSKGSRYEGGIAYLLGQWQGFEQYRPERFVTLSGGDSWTGPFESTVLRGRPMVDVMNTTGYDAQIIGNHDFDFGVAVLQERAQQARFPLLAANLYSEGAGTRPAYAQGHAVIRAGEARVGVIGLGHPDTAVLTHPRNIAGLRFTEQEGALRREVAALRADGVDVIVAVFHQPVEDLLPMIPLLRSLGIPFAGSGHSHVANLTVDRGPSEGAEDDVILCNPGAYARAYCRVTLTVLSPPSELISHQETLVRVEGLTSSPPFPPAPEINQIIEQSKVQAEVHGREVLGSSRRGLNRDDPEQRLGHLVVDAWLEAIPYAQIAITNAGGLRQDIDAGEITLKTLVGVLPFDNYLIVAEITGAQLREVLEHTQSIAGGVRFAYRCGPGGRALTELTDMAGKPIADDQLYRVVVNEFIYRGGDRYRLREYDPEAEETALHWREPVAQHLRNLTRQGLTIDPEADHRARALDGLCPRTQ